VKNTAEARRIKHNGRYAQASTQDKNKKSQGRQRRRRGRDGEDKVAVDEMMTIDGTRTTVTLQEETKKVKKYLSTHGLIKKNTEGGRQGARPSAHLQ